MRNPIGGHAPSHQGLSRRGALQGLWAAGGLLLSTGCATGRSDAAAATAIPQRVAVFDLGALDALQALGVAPAGVPNANIPPALGRYTDERYAKVGSLFEPDMAALKALKPDLILVGGRSANKRAALQAVAPTLDLSVNPQAYVAGSLHNLLLLGRLFGRQAEAAGLAERLLARVRALQAQGAQAGTGLVLFAAGTALMPHLPQARFGTVYELSGVTPLAWPDAAAPVAARAAAGDEQAAQARREAQASELKRLLARDPHWLFVLDRPSATGGAAVAPGLLAAHEDIQRTTAWKKKQVVHLDAPNWYLVGHGPAMLSRSIDQLAQAFAAAKA